jgi:hypothetical protein
MAKIELLKEAYAIIDGIPEQAFDLEKIITDGGTSVGCGTVACAAGWLSIHPKFGKLLGADVTLNGESTTIYWPGGQWWDDAVGSLGLDNEEYYFFNREVKLVNKVVATNTADISNVTIEATYKVKFQVAGEEFEIAVSDSNCVKLARLLEVLG